MAANAGWVLHSLGRDGDERRVIWSKPLCTIEPGIQLRRQIT